MQYQRTRPYHERTPAEFMAGLGVTQIHWGEKTKGKRHFAVAGLRRKAQVFTCPCHVSVPAKRFIRQLAKKSQGAFVRSLGECLAEMKANPLQ